MLYRDADVSAIAFHPTRRMAVSSSYGGDFKVTGSIGVKYLSVRFCLCKAFHFADLG